MWKGIISAFVAQAPPIIKFKEHWARVVQFYSKAGSTYSDKISYQESARILAAAEIVSHLDKMISILVKEDSQSGVPEGTGPCFEHFVEKKLMETLCHIAIEDKPAGTLCIVLRTLVNLIGSISQPLIPHQNLRVPLLELLTHVADRLEDFRSRYTRTQIQQLITSPDGQVHSYTDIKKQFIELVETLCCKVEAEPTLFDFFCADVEKKSEDEKPTTDFLLFSFLLPYINDPGDDGKVSRRGLSGCIKLNKGLVTKVVIRSGLSQSLVRGLCDLYRDLPKTIDSIDALKASKPWEVFRDRLKFLDQLAIISKGDVLANMLRTLEENFFGQIVGPSLLQTSESEAKSATIYARAILQSIESVPVARCFLQVLIGSDIDPEVPGDDTGNLLRFTLINRITDVSEQMSTASLQLFELLLRRHTPEVLDNLVLRNLVACSHFKPDNSNQSFPLKVVDGINALFPEFLRPSKDESYNLYYDDAQRTVAMCLPAFDGWFDSEDEYSDLKPSSTSAQSPIPSPAPSSDALSEKSGAAEGETKDESSPVSSNPLLAPETKFYEGAFLDAIFTKFEGFLENSMEINLLLTGIISSLAQVPNPLVHTYLLDGSAPLATGVRSFPQILAEVSAKATEKSADKATAADGKTKISREFERRLNSARRALGIETDISAMGIADLALKGKSQVVPVATPSAALPPMAVNSGPATATPAPAVPVQKYFDTPEERNFLHAVVVMEEFRKELVAIVSAKYKFSLMRKLRVPSVPTTVTSSDQQ